MASPEAVDDGDVAMPEASNSVATPPSPSSVHNSIPYSARFTASLVHPILHPPARHTKAASGIRILAPGSSERVKSGSVRFEDIDFSGLPDVQSKELPLSLDDSRRLYASGIPGIKLTHPGGWVEGGPGAYPALSNGGQGGSVKMEELPAFVRGFIERHEVTTPEALQRAVKSEREEQLEELRRRMRERQEVVRRNERTQTRIDELVAEREMERRVHERAREMRGMSKRA